MARLSTGAGRVDGIVRVAAVGDLHCSKASRGFQPLFSHISETADLLLLAGGLTLRSADEAQVLAGELAVLHAPAAAVLGNTTSSAAHDAAGNTDLDRVIDEDPGR